MAEAKTELNEFLDGLDPSNVLCDKCERPMLDTEYSPDLLVLLGAGLALAGVFLLVDLSSLLLLAWGGLPIWLVSVVLAPLPLAVAFVSLNSACMWLA